MVVKIANLLVGSFGWLVIITLIGPSYAAMWLSRASAKAADRLTLFSTWLMFHWAEIVSRFFRVAILTGERRQRYLDALGRKK